MNTHQPIDAAALRAHSGLSLMQAMLAGELPRAPIARLMNMSGGEVGPGFVVFEGEPSGDHYNPLGTVHGGYAATLLDSCMGCAVHTTLPAGTGYTTIDLNITYLKAMTADTGKVFARGEVLSSGRLIATARGTLTDSTGRLLATGTTTCLVFPIGKPA